MSGYAILRAKKLKSFGAVARSARHTFREQPTPNADPDRLSANKTFGARSTGGVVDALKSALPEKRRKDAVLCIEYLITASPEAFKRHGGSLSDTGDGYFSDALKWLKKRHGAANVLSATVHLDETTPHLVAYVVPKTPDGRLTARHFLGGPKVLRAMQDSFHAACAASKGLLRGVRGSNAKHESIKAFYANMTATDSAPKLSRRDYAAAAVGLETKAWKQAQELAKSRALAAERASKTRKATESRATALDEGEGVIAHRKIVLKQHERELELERERLEVYRRELDAIRGRIESAEAENAALKRRLEPGVKQVQSPRRGPPHDEPEGPAP